MKAATSGILVPVAGTDATTLPSDREARRHRWEDLTTWPLMLAALVFLVAYAWPILDPTLPTAVDRLAAVVMRGTWLVFLTDYVVRLRLAHDRPAFVRHHPLDLLSVAVPVLRPLQLLRVVTVLDRAIGRRLGSRVAMYAVAVTTAAVGLGALAILDAERDAPGATITSFGDALWWAWATVTTVGYGDRYPVTTAGRGVAAVLMLCGIALLGLVTASLASFLVDRYQDEDEEEDQARDDARFAALHDELRELRAEIRALRRPESL
ncbi:potassium channel family protein [Nocardioides marmoribigeumensis]